METPFATHFATADEWASKLQLLYTAYFDPFVSALTTWQFVNWWPELLAWRKAHPPSRKFSSPPTQTGPPETPLILLSTFPVWRIHRAQAPTCFRSRLPSYLKADVGVDNPHPFCSEAPLLETFPLEMCRSRLNSEFSNANLWDVPQSFTPICTSSQFPWEILLPWTRIPLLTPFKVTFMDLHLGFYGWIMDAGILLWLIETSHRSVISSHFGQKKHLHDKLFSWALVQKQGYKLWLTLVYNFLQIGFWIMKEWPREENQTLVRRRRWLTLNWDTG